METLVSAIVGDLISRSISFVVDSFGHRWREGGIEHAPNRLRRVLLRVQAVVEEADRRCVTNQAILRQLQLMRDGVYRGYYLLNAIKCQGVLQEKAQDPEVSRRHDPSSCAVYQFNPAKRPCTLSARTTNTAPPGDTRRTKEAEAELRKVLHVLERMATDMKELIVFIVFLSSYPLTRREPYSGHLWLANRMFGREAEQERIISFLLEPEQELGVLPVIGRARVGKSTLVEHVCLNERVRRHFSLIVFLGEGDIKDGESPHIGDNGIVKHQDPDSSGKSLVVIELDCDVDENTWWRRTVAMVRGRRTSRTNTLVNKLIVTSRSEKIASFGTTQALELKLLPREAYWYFFKTIAFGSMDPEDHPELASVFMEMADLLNRSFIAANILGTLLRANPCSQFWQRVLKGVRHYLNMHLLHFGEHPSDLLAKGRPIYLWRLRKTDTVLVAFHYIHQACSAQEHDLPKITMMEVHIGSAKPQGKFEVVVWRSNIPPYYTYLMSCGAQKSSTLLRVPPRNKQIRQRQTRQ